jgi:DnaJ-class molecular chaperone
MDGEYKRMKKIICDDCKGSGLYKDGDVLESCQSCQGNGYHVYIEEFEAYGAYCKKGTCE